MEVNSSPYTLCGSDGILVGRMPLLLHSRHSFWLLSLSFRTNARAALNGRMLVLPGGAFRLSYPRKSGYEVNSSPYVLSGLEGILEGRMPLFLHSSHSF